MASSHDKTVKLLKEAVAAVDAAEVPSDLRPAALQIAAERLRGGIGDPNRPKNEHSAGPALDSPNDEPLATIAMKLGAQPEEAARVFDVDDDGVHLVVARSRLANSKKTAMKEVFQLVVAARQALGEQWTSVADVRAVAEDRGVLNVPNWAAAVKALDGTGFRFRGTAQAREVKINHVGYEAAEKVVSRLVSGE